MASAITAKPAFVVRETGNLFAVTLDGVRDIPKIRVWWQEYLRQCWFISKVTAIPVMLISIPFGMVIALHVGSFSRQLGAESATGAAMVLAIVREAAPVATALLIAGAGGSAMTADIGSRKIRDEISAMQVMSVDPLKDLVVPRVIAAALATVLMTAIVIVGGIFGGYVYAVVVKGTNSGAFFQGFGTLARLPDLYLALAKGFVFGVVAAAISAWKGLYAKAGPSGVGMAVNRGVVLTLLALVFVNLIMTFAYFSLVPDAIR